MKPSFDPYDEWLQIPDSLRPPGDHELLGLAAGEPDADRIQAAYQKRYEFVRRYQNGRYSEAAQRILHELSCASESMKAAAFQRELPTEPYLPEDLVEIVTALVGTKQSAHSTPQANPIASSPEFLQIHPAPQAALSEISFEPTDEQQLHGEDELLSKLVTGLAVACGIIASLGLWIPEVAIYVVPLAMVFGCWHVLNAFNSPSWNALHCHIRTWLKAKKRYWSAWRAWSAATATHGRVAKELRMRIESLVDQRSALPSNKESDIEDIRKRARETQLHSFLGKYTIRDNLDNIPYVGTQRLNALESCGINTAYDVQYDRIISINGCGAATASSLVNWRSHVAHRFKFNAETIPKQELINVERKYAQQEQHTDHEITLTLNKLRLVNETSQRELAPMVVTLRDAENASKQAWVLVHAQMTSPTKSFIVVLLTAFVVPTLVLVIVRTFE